MQIQLVQAVVAVCKVAQAEVQLGAVKIICKGAGKRKLAGNYLLKLRDICIKKRICLNVYCLFPQRIAYTNTLYVQKGTNLFVVIFKIDIFKLNILWNYLFDFCKPLRSPACSAEF